MSVRESKVYATGETTTDTEPSLDVFYKVTPSLNAALTINTDFSATEIDDRQVNLTRFSLFFPEKRDFFLQDADIFEFGRIGSGGFQGGGRRRWRRRRRRRRRWWRRRRESRRFRAPPRRTRGRSSRASSA